MEGHVIDSKVVGKFHFGWHGLIPDSDGYNMFGTVPKDAWIWGRFDEPEKARKHFKCNPYSGKYNFHYEPLIMLRIALKEIANLEK